MKTTTAIHTWRGSYIIAALLLGILCIASTGTTQAQAESADGQVYIVQPRDSLTKIARNVFDGQVSANDIFKATNAKAAVDPSFSWLANPNVIVSGQKLWVPTTTAADATSADNTSADNTSADNTVAPTADAASATDEASSEAANVPAVVAQLRIADQAIGAGNAIVVDEVTVGTPATLSVVRQTAGTPDTLIGQVSIAAGTSVAVQVPLSATVPFGTELLALLTTEAHNPTLHFQSSQATAAEGASSTALLPPPSLASASFRAGLSADGFATQSFIDIMNATSEFGVLYSALQSVGLTDELSGAGPFTLYLPTNRAFAQLSEDQLELLLSDMSTLEDVLRYHIVPGRIEAADLGGVRDLQTLSGGVLAIRSEEQGLVVGNAGVLYADVPTANGVLYVIDRVLLPPTFAERLAAASAATTNPELN